MPRSMSWKGVTKPKYIDLTLQDLDADRKSADLQRRDRLRLSSGTLDAKQYRSYVSMLETLHKSTTMMPVLRALRDKKISLVQLWHAYQKGPEATLKLLTDVTATRLLDLIPKYKKALRGVREIDARARKITRFINSIGPNATPSDFTSAAVEDFLGSLDYAENARRKSTALSLGTVNNYRIAISSFATWMMRRGLLVKHPIAYRAVAKPKIPRHRLPEPFGAKDFKDYLEAAGNYSGIARVALTTILHTGADLGEILFTYQAKRLVKKHPEQGAAIGLRAKDVVPGDHASFIRLQRAKWKGAKERMVPVPKALIAELRGLMALYGVKGEQEVFDALRQHTLAKAHQAGRTAIGRPHLRFKDLRHIAAIRWVESGVDIRKVQEWLGHETLGQTAVYIDYAPAPKWIGEAVEKAAAGWTDGEDVPDITRRRRDGAQAGSEEHGGGDGAADRGAEGSATGT